LVSTAFYLGKEKLRHSLGRPSRSDFVQLEFSQFFISVFFLFQLISRPIVEITKINADVNEIIPSVTTNMINVANGI